MVATKFSIKTGTWSHGFSCPRSTVSTRVSATVSPLRPGWTRPQASVLHTAPPSSRVLTIAQWPHLCHVAHCHCHAGPMTCHWQVHVIVIPCDKWTLDHCDKPLFIFHNLLTSSSYTQTKETDTIDMWKKLIVIWFFWNEQKKQSHVGWEKDSGKNHGSIKKEKPSHLEHLQGVTKSEKLILSNISHDILNNSNVHPTLWKNQMGESIEDNLFLHSHL